MFDTQHTDPSWQPILHDALNKMDQAYIETLSQEADFLPTADKIFNAFRLPVHQVNYVLFGESPYPRAASANGYSFWDDAVHGIWSDTGLSKAVNRATSLRNIIKLLLISENHLAPNNVTQTAIANIDKRPLISTLDELFNGMLKRGFLLLNATPILRTQQKNQDAKEWLPFINHILQQLHQQQPNAQLILFGKIAEKIQALPASKPFKQLVTEHPYNLSFISNQSVQDLFKPLKLLSL